MSLTSKLHLKRQSTLFFIKHVFHQMKWKVKLHDKCVATTQFSSRQIDRYRQITQFERTHTAAHHIISLDLGSWQEGFFFVLLFLLFVFVFWFVVQKRSQLIQLANLFSGKCSFIYPMCFYFLISCTLISGCILCNLCNLMQISSVQARRCSHRSLIPLSVTRHALQR